MFSGKVFTWWIFFFCVLSSCGSSTVELRVVPNEPIDFGSGPKTVAFEVAYNVTEIGTHFGITINMGSAAVAQCRPGIGLVPLTPNGIGMALNATDLPPKGCSSLNGTVAIPISSGVLEFGLTFSAETLSEISAGWTAGLYDAQGVVRVSSPTLNITVGDLRKRAAVTIEWSDADPEMVFRCFIGEVRPVVDLVLTVSGVTSATVQTPGTAELKLPHNQTLDGGNFSCSVDVVYPVMKSLPDSFTIKYAPVFQADPEPVPCLHRSCQFTFNCSDHGVRAYPAHTLTWLQLNSTDGAIVVNGPGEYTCQATNALGTDTVVFRVVKEPTNTTPNTGSSTVTTEPTTSTTHKVCDDGKECQNDGILNLKTCKCKCEDPYYGHFCQHNLWTIVAVVVVLGVYIVYIVVNIVAAFMPTCFPKAGKWFLVLGVVCKFGAVAGGIVVMHRIFGKRSSSNDPQIGLKGTADGRMKPEVMARGGGGAATYDDVDLRSGPITAPRSLPPLRTAPRRGPEKPPRSNVDPRHTSEEVPSSNDLYTEVVRKVDRRAPGPGNRRGQGEEARMVENTIYGSN